MNYFQINILKWAKNNARRLPWKRYNDAYTIWLSEVLLQQTRVQQGLPYFNAFKKKYPTVFEMAKAQEDEILKLWEGLGYYARARNMYYTAQYLVNECNGIFPENYEGLLKLKGVGEYTAAAIASFAYNEPVAVVDGNVYRVLSRFFGIKTPIDSTMGKKEFKLKAQENLLKNKAAIYNQAIMDFGALQCSPKKPNCKTCPLNKKCKALQTNTINLLPKKSKKVKQKHRYFIFIIVKYKDKQFLVKRTQKDIWQGLFQFPLIEVDETVFLKEEQFNQLIIDNFKLSKFSFDGISQAFKQKLTHQKIMAKFVTINSSQKNHTKNNWIAVNEKEMLKFAFPKIIDCFLKDKVLHLNLK